MKNLHFVTLNSRIFKIHFSKKNIWDFFFSEQFLPIRHPEFSNGTVTVYLCNFFFGDVGKRLDKKAMVKFEIFDVTGWRTNN